MFGPYYDVILSLKEVPFSRRNDLERRDIFVSGRPEPVLSEVLKDQRVGSSFFRSFQTTWYDTHPWLCGSFYCQKLFCWPCLLLSRTKSVWATEGFYDLKNLSRSCQKHATSANHMTCFMNFKRLVKNMPTLKDLIQENSLFCKSVYNEKVRKNRVLLNILIDTTILLAKQELSFRGHRENEYSENRGNFIEIFNFKIKDNEEMTKHIANLGKSFSSKTIQNDLILCVSEVVRDVISNEIKETDFFSVIVDDTTDITEKSQCAISLRYLGKDNLIIYERFLGFFDVSENGTADALFDLVSTNLAPYNYKQKLVAQCYDGASVMAGHLNGLQAKIKKEAPQALFIHCSAHKLNLVLQDSCKAIKECRVFFATLTGIPNYFHQSAKRTFFVDNLVGKRIPAFTKTRWASRSKIITLLFDNYLEFIPVFQKIIDDKTCSAASINGARGFLKSLLDYEFVFLLFSFSNIFSKTNILFEILQKKALDINFCKEKICNCIDNLKQIRSDEEFLNIKNKVTNLLDNAKEKVEINIAFKQKGNENLKVLFFEIIDNIIMQMTEKFLELVNHKNFKTFKTKFPSDLLTELCHNYKDFENKKSALKTELTIIYSDDQFMCSVEKY
ncbi:unnamed protein product [Brassicogethes aeneus]|uniref:DUF4371 domain-containing protein n=1 Tax=Brassicogethes aeneus TaxID=1431903 RepID=A0A9P0B409_BRAAE|nr:unnamed protein product [Brassicogethes aeneus]